MIETLHNKMKDKGFNQLGTQEKIDLLSSAYQVPYNTTKEDALKMLKSKIASNAMDKKTKKNSNIRYLFTISSIAASLTLMIGVWYFIASNRMDKIIAQRGQHTEYKLPDGTLISMNAESKIELKLKDFNTKRELNMEGEAFFNVKKGSTFTINTKFADIKILGTSFNVLSRKNTFKVTCVTGKVQVSNFEQSFVITPGQSVEMSGEKLTKYIEKDINSVITWRNGEFIYEYTPLNVIFEEIERQYNVTFATPDIEKKYFTGSFSNKNLVDALDIVCIPMGLSYEIGSNGKIQISESKQ